MLFDKSNNIVYLIGQEEGVDAGDVDLEEGEKGKEVDGEGEGDEEDEIEEDPDKRNRLDGYYVAMGIILGLCILGTLSYMAGNKTSSKIYRNCNSENYVFCDKL